MISHPQRILLGGLFVGVVGIASYVLQSDRGMFPGKMSGGDRPGASVLGGFDGRRTAAPPIDSNSIDATSTASVGQVLQAIQDSLQRNDLASARVLLDAVRTYHKDDDQALALQKELQVRQAQADGATKNASKNDASDSSDTIRRAKPQPAPAHAVVKAVHLHRPVVTARAIAPAAADESSPPTVSEPVAVVVREPDVISTPPVQAAFAPIVESRPVPVPAHLALPAPAVVVQAPKTRAQVREELERARTDGSLPRFGNPDPAGPGTSTISSLPEAQE